MIGQASANTELAVPRWESHNGTLDQGVAQLDTQAGHDYLTRHSSLDAA
jgi:hypothetical protein